MNMHSPGRSGDSTPGGILGGLRRLMTSVHGLLILGAIGAWIWISVIFVQSASRREPPPAPAAMEAVDWTSPDSSVYCLACHRTLSPAVGGLGALHGHPLNVRMSESQLAAVRDLGTIAGRDGTVICMTCHVLSAEKPFMLADTLEGSALCQRCHAEQFVLGGAAHDFLTTAPELTNRLGLTPLEAGPCSVCHAAHTYAQEYVACENDQDGRCVSCHQTPRCGGDATKIAFEHSGAQCTECHNPHSDQFGCFLKRPPADTCTDCHTGFGEGLLAGMHPVGVVNTPAPGAAPSTVATVGKGATEITCQVCHSAHSANFASLLLADPAQNAMCLTCHEAELAARTADGTLPRHGRQPALDDAQIASVLGWGGQVSAMNTLVCSSCHLMHETAPNNHLLAMNPRSDDACASCHPKQAEVIGSPHDLRIKSPDEPNILGVTASAGGACSACHLGHGSARTAVPAPGDPTGVCTTCHQAGACAENVLVGDVVHPKTACTDCHDPHLRTHGRFLAKASADLCADCHAAQYALVGGPHDFRTKPEAWPAQASTITDLCLRCHFAHGGERPDLYRFGSAEHDSYHDGACLTCHSDAGWNADSSIAIIHPHEISADQQRVPLALVPKDDQGNMRMGCRTCHDPHGGVEPVHLARVAPGVPTENLCLQCHDHKHILMSGHSSTRLSGLGIDTDSCKPCHAMHATRDGAWGQMLSPRFLMEDCQTIGDENVGCVPCLSCHRVGGIAPLREVFTHPQVAMNNIYDKSAPGFLPLFNAEGHIDPQGQVTCRTCHLAHGWVPEGATAQSAIESLTPEQQSARQFSLRPFVSPNVCMTCHGMEARWRFLFFHNPDRRKGPTGGQ
ncbi:MAG: cytochrome c3 family protein [Phycisphaerales bacterium]|nr:cytochrome c3 family protein [Phycisphaerales bacterium]